MPLITLTTDFGTDDTFVAMMKGVILSIATSAQIVDLTHGIPPQDIAAAAMALEETCGYFPKGTIHVGVVDPGVGSARAAVAIETERAFYVGPDNGIFELIVRKEGLKQAVRIENPQYRMQSVSPTFHGRDIFAPAAAHLACFVSLTELGPPCARLATLTVPKPQLRASELEIHVLRADRFGNLITDLTRELYQKWNPRNSALKIDVSSAKFDGVVHETYSDVAAGAPVAYFGSAGRLEIGVRDGSAANHFKAGKGTAIVLEKKTPSSPELVKP